VPFERGLEDYLLWVCTEYPTDLTGMKLALDCANGSSCFTAEKALTRLGATCTVLNSDPDGLNINTDCGSTHPEKFQEFVKNGDFDLGLMFDGDADRQIMVAPDGRLVDGDFVLYICAKHYRDKGILTNNTIVTTVMANLGLFKAMEREGIEVASTQVGDKYVYEKMCQDDDIIGGEQSGHIIFKRHETTGDGLVTALAIMEIMKEKNMSVSELMEGLKIYPQLLVNVRVSNKQTALDDAEVKQAIDEVNQELAGNGRLLVRPSGTEPLIRVMAEAESDEICERVVMKVADIVKAKFGAE
ncbi:MAG: phosphoglucosamine mutase, partial [Solobacterium sp.]|nr:phosphoglucosamine mutase [Solobacterium sp.]